MKNKIILSFLLAFFAQSTLIAMPKNHKRKHKESNAKNNEKKISEISKFNELELKTIKSFLTYALKLTNPANVTIYDGSNVTDPIRTEFYDSFSKLKSDSPLRVQTYLNNLIPNLFDIFDDILPYLSELKRIKYIHRELKKNKDMSLIPFFIENKSVKDGIIEFYEKVCSMTKSIKNIVSFNALCLDLENFIRQQAQNEESIQTYKEYQEQFKKLSEDHKVNFFLENPKKLYYYLIADIQKGIENKEKTIFSLAYCWYLRINNYIAIQKNWLLENYNEAEVNEEFNKFYNEFFNEIEKIRGNKEKINDVIINIDVELTTRAINNL